MAKGKATVIGAKKQAENGNTVMKAGSKQVTLKSMMEKGRQNLRVAKMRAKEQLLGKSGDVLGKMSGGAPTITTRGGLALVERAKQQRLSQFKEAKRKMEKNRMKKLEKGDELMEGENQNFDVKIKQEMLDEPIKFSTAQGRGNMEIDKKDDETKVPNEINMDGAEFTEDGTAETDEEYKARLGKEDHAITLQKADISEEEWEQIEVEAEKEKQAKELEEIKEAKEGGTDSQSKGESSEERSEQMGDDEEDQSNSESDGKDAEEEDDQSVESNTGNKMDNIQEEDEADVIIIEEPPSDDSSENENEQANTNEVVEGARSEPEEPLTPKVTRISFADIAKGKGKTQQHLGAVVTYEHTCRFEISALIDRMPKDATDDQQAAAVKGIIVSILKRFKHITKKVAIQPWYSGTLLPSIVRTEDISEDLNTLKDYIAHEGSRNRQFRNGRNSRLLVNVTFDKVAGGGDEIAHLWQQQTKERKLQQLMPINLKVAVMQSEQYYPIGSLVNSGEKQVTTQLQKDLSELLDVEISIAYRDVPAEYRTIEKFWVGAKGKAGAGNIRGSYMWAPQALVIYTKLRTGTARLHIIKEMMQRYGRMTENGEYPTLPDGSRMRFIPPESMAPVSQRYKIRDSIKRQIDLRSVTTTIDMEFAFDINKIVEEGPHEGKSLGSLVLGLTSSDIKYGGVPFFKHFVHKWAMDFRYRGIAVAVFTNMAPIATEIMGSLQGIMEKSYGPEVGLEINTFRGGATLTAEGDLSNEIFQIQLEDDDWFERTGKFVMTGMYNTEQYTDKREKDKEIQEPAIRPPSGADMLMDTHSIVTMNSLESNVTSELAGGTDSNQAGMPAGRAGTSYAEAARLAEEATKARTEEENNSNTDDVNQMEESVQVNHDDEPQDNQQGNQQGINKDDRQGNQQPDQQSNQQVNQQHNQQGHQQDNRHNQQSEQPNPVTPKNDKHMVGASGGRGRGGGRGNYSSNLRNVNFGRGGRGLRFNQSSIISPNGKIAGDIGGSGPNVTRVTRSQSSQEEWKRTGTEEDEKKLRDKIAQQPAGAASAGDQP